MIKCSNCNKELEDGTKFCDQCGTPTVMAETEIAEEPVVQEVSTETEEVISEENVVPEEPTLISEEEKKPGLIQVVKDLIETKPTAVRLGGIVAVALVVVLIVSMIFGGAGQSSYALYIKDKELFYAQASKWKPWQVTEELVESGDTTNEDLAYASDWLGWYVVLSEDGKKIFYIDKVSESDGMSIYCRKVNSKKEPQKIASEVESFTVNAKGNLVTYLDAEDGDLYQHNLKDKEKIASEVKDFAVSDDGKIIIYQDEDGDLYTKKAGKDKKKLVGGADSIEHVSEDFETVYYLKDDNLYRKQQGKDAVKIGSDVQSVIKVYDSGEIYYLKADSDEMKLSSYVVDDMKDIDDAMEEPVEPEYPSYFDYDSYDEYEAAYDQYDVAYDEYWDAMEEYYDKMDRDDLREELEEETIDSVTYELCYYNGKKEVVISDSATDWETYAQDKATIVYTTTDQANIEKVKLSEIDSIYDVEDMVEEALGNANEYYLAVESTSSKIEQEDVESFDLDAEGKTLYMIADVSEENDEGELYKVKISGKKAGKSKKIDDDVCMYYTSFIEDSYIYYKDVDDDGESGELYINGKNVDSDVSLGSVKYTDGTYAYMVEWDEDDECGTLKKYNGKKAVTLSEDVHDFTFLPDGEISYLYDYNVDKCRGDFYICKGSKPKKIDEDVVAIIPVYDGE